MFGGKNDVRARVGERVRLLRQARDWTQEELAARADVSYKLVGQIERAEGNPTIETLQSLSEALDVDVTDLFGTPALAMRESYVTSDELARLRKALDSAGTVLDKLAPPRRRRKRQ